MATKKVIAVVGATGAQGGGLVRAILNDHNSDFSVRAITRDKNSDKAKELAKLGADIVAADIDDEASLTRAFEGAHSAFCVTFFWAHFKPELEVTQAHNMAKAAKSCNLKHVIWSTMEDSRKFVPLSDNRMPTLMGNYKVPHLDGKGSADHFFTDHGVPTTFLLTSFYWDNLIYFGMGPQRGPDGSLKFTLPLGDKKLPGIAAEDIGKCAYNIFKRGQEFVGKTVGIAGEQLTGVEMANCLTKALGEDVQYNKVSFETYRGFGFPGADDLANMFQFKHDFQKEFCGARNVEFCRALNPQLQSFDQWLSRYKAMIPINKVA